MLGDAAGLAAGDVGVADLIEQAGFTVVDVPQHRYDGGAWLERGRIIGFFGEDAGRLSLLDDFTVLNGLEAEVCGDFGSGFEVDGLGDVGHQAVGDEGLDDRHAADAQ